MTVAVIPRDQKQQQGPAVAMTWNLTHLTPDRAESERPTRENEKRYFLLRKGEKQKKRRETHKRTTLFLSFTQRSGERGETLKGWMSDRNTDRATTTVQYNDHGNRDRRRNSAS